MMRSKQTSWRDDEISDEDDTLCSVFWDFCFLNFSNRPIYRIEQVKRNALTYGEITHSHSHTHNWFLLKEQERKKILKLLPNIFVRSFRRILHSNPGYRFFNQLFCCFQLTEQTKIAHIHTHRNTPFENRERGFHLRFKGLRFEFTSLCTTKHGKMIWRKIFRKCPLEQVKTGGNKRN